MRVHRPSQRGSDYSQAYLNVSNGSISFSLQIRASYQLMLRLPLGYSGPSLSHSTVPLLSHPLRYFTFAI
jgi:hypothetical protein